MIRRLRAPPATRAGDDMAHKKKASRRRRDSSGSPEEAPYRVGYGRPPQATRFKPKQSGNPKGRPRRIPTLSAVFKKVLEEQVEIREGERVRRMSNLHVLVRNAVRRAQNGDPKLLRVLSIMLRIELGSPPEDTDADEFNSATDEAILADFIARHALEKQPSVNPVNQSAHEVTKPDTPVMPGRAKP